MAELTNNRSWKQNKDLKRAARRDREYFGSMGPRAEAEEDCLLPGRRAEAGRGETDLGAEAELDEGLHLGGDAS
eukprot:6919922-Pyramimonas_sp.AAC.1